MFKKIFNLFCPEQDFPKKSGSVRHNVIWSFKTILSFRKKYEANSKKTSEWRERQALLYRTLLAITGGSNKS